MTARQFVHPLPGYRTLPERRAVALVRDPQAYRVVVRRSQRRKIVGQAVLALLIVFVAVLVLSLAGVALVPDAAA